MKIEEIEGEWVKDSKIDIADLGNEALKIPQLHSKYFKMYTKERLRLKSLNFEMKKLRLEKHEFFLLGPTEDTPESWELPPQGKPLKADIQIGRAHV